MSALRGGGRNCHICHICHFCADTCGHTCSQATPILLPGNPNLAVHSPWKPEWQFSGNPMPVHTASTCPER